MANEMISLCFIEKTLLKDILHSYLIPHLVIHFAKWVIPALRVIICELNFAECLSAVLSYRKNIGEKSSIQLRNLVKIVFFVRINFCKLNVARFFVGSNFWDFGKKSQNPETFFLSSTKLKWSTLIKSQKIESLIIELAGGIVIF